MTDLECTVESHGEDTAVVAAGGYAVHSIAYYLAIRAGGSWSPLALLATQNIQGTGGHYAEFVVESVRTIERGARRFLWVESRDREGSDHFDGSEGNYERVDVTLCRLPDGENQAAGCPLQAPIFISNQQSYAQEEIGELDSPVTGAGGNHAAPQATRGEDQDEEVDEPSYWDHEETVRLQIRVRADGATAEIVLLEGEPYGWLQEKLGVHSLDAIELGKPGTGDR